MRCIPAIEKALAACNKPTEIVRGTKHWQIRVGGRLVGILPSKIKTTDPRGVKNLVSQIKRADRDDIRERAFQGIAGKTLQSNSG